MRRRILEDHARLRVLIAELDDVALRVMDGDRRLALRMRALAEGLRDTFLHHLDLEDGVLVPVLRTLDAWGTDRAARLAAEHRAQRERFGRHLGELVDQSRAPEDVAADLHALAIELLLDMLHEEKTVLDADLLRDDPVENSGTG